MGIFDRYRTPADLPQKIPVFPLPGALLLPRAELPLNIFEPRYLAMVDHALSTDRLIGIIQPIGGRSLEQAAPLMKVGCVGRIASFTETADDRVLLTLAGVCRFQVVQELDVVTPFRQVIADFYPFAIDLASDDGANDVNRPALLKAFRDYLAANNMKANWNEVDHAPTDILVNTLSLLAPYDPQEKQALLEAPDLKTRADVLVALTEVALSKMAPGGKPRLQ
jgi:Lon protease-like protein